MDDNDLFSTETINVPIGFRLFAIAQLSLSENYSAKWDHNFKEEWMDKCQPTCTHDWHPPPSAGPHNFPATHTSSMDFMYLNTAT